MAQQRLDEVVVAVDQAGNRDRLASHGLSVLVPDKKDRAVVHSVIYDELCLGVVSEVSRAAYMAIIHRLVAAGAAGVVGCTEIELMIDQDDCPVPVFPDDTLARRGGREPGARHRLSDHHRPTAA